MVPAFHFKEMLNYNSGFEDGEDRFYWGTSKRLRLAGCRAEVAGQSAMRPRLLRWVAWSLGVGGATVEVAMSNRGVTVGCRGY